MENLEKKFILTAGLSHLSEDKFLENVDGKMSAMDLNSGLIPAGLSPTVAEGIDALKEVRDDISDRKVLEEQLKSKNEKIAAGKLNLRNIIVTNWMPDLQVSLNGNVTNAKLLGFGVKGLDIVPSDVSVTNSYPKLDKLDMGYLVHTLYFVNSTTNRTPIPDDGLSIEIYEFFGKDEPKSIKEMSHVGKAVRGKFTNHFTEDQLGQTVWYAFVYSPKKEGVIAQLAPKKSSVVV
jgi:hypothetical protein